MIECDICHDILPINEVTYIIAPSKEYKVQNPTFITIKKCAKCKGD